MNSLAHADQPQTGGQASFLDIKSGSVIGYELRKALRR
jgi:hypothetical protein